MCRILLHLSYALPAQARIAEEAGACAVMALERVPADIRATGGVARMVSQSILIVIVLFVRALGLSSILYPSTPFPASFSPCIGVLLLLLPAPLTLREEAFQPPFRPTLFIFLIFRPFLSHCILNPSWSLSDFSDTRHDRVTPP